MVNPVSAPATNHPETERARQRRRARPEIPRRSKHKNETTAEVASRYSSQSFLRSSVAEATALQRRARWPCRNRGEAQTLLRFAQVQMPVLHKLVEPLRERAAHS